MVRERCQRGLIHNSAVYDGESGKIHRYARFLEHRFRDRRFGGQNRIDPREVAKVDSKPVVTPSKGEGQPSAGADQMAEAVEPEARDFHDLRECSAWANDVEETQIPVPDEAWYSEGEPEEPDWTNIEFVEWNPLFNKSF